MTLSLLILSYRLIHPFLFLIYLFCFIEVQLIYNAVLVSGVQHSNSVIHIYVHICVCEYIYMYIYSFSDSFPL